MQEMDKYNEAIRSIAVDLAYLRKTKTRLVEENEAMHKKINAL